MSNLLMDRAKFHVNIATKLFINKHTLLVKLALAVSDSARGNYNGAIANASYFEK